MSKKIQVFFICTFAFAVFFSVVPRIMAGQGAPPAPAQISPGSGSGNTGAVVMDPNAHVVLPTDSFDFGSVYEGNDVFHDFIIKNEGTSDLRIINVKSG
jgi:hypothetical protein